MTTRKTEQPAVGPWLDKMEDTRTINAPVMVVALRKATRDLEWYASEHSAGTRQIDNGGLALQSLTVIERMLAAGAAADDCVTRESHAEPRSSAAPGWPSLRWTAEEPKAAGWWWHRWKAHGEDPWSTPEVWHVEHGPDCFGDVGLHVDSVPLDALMDECWQEWGAGPLPEPESASDAQTTANDV